MAHNSKLRTQNSKFIFRPTFLRSCILLLEPLHNLGYDRVVVEGGVIVMTQHLALGIGQFRALVFITACPEAGLLRAVTQLIVYMLSHQVEDGEVVLLLEVLQTVIMLYPL